MENMTTIEMRAAEVQAYEANIATYEKLLSTLDGNWDDDLAYLKDMEPQEAARQCPMDRLARLAVLQQHDQVQNILKTEIVECAKAQAILNIL